MDPFSPSYDPLPKVLSLAEYISKGTTSVVRKGKKKYNDELVAVKIKKVSDAEAALAMMSCFNIPSSFRHPNIVRCSCVIGEPQVPGAILVVMELINGPALTDYVMKAENGRLHESMCCFLFEQLLNALDFIHLQRVIHRDVVPDNIMLDFKHCPREGVRFENELPTLKIVGFSSAVKLTAGDRPTVGGTLLYRAPEYGKMQVQTELGDVWSAGLCLFHMMCGEDYFGAHKCSTSTSLEYFEWLANYTHNFQSDSRFDYISNKGIQVLSQCLQKDPVDRPTPRMLLSRGTAWFLQHLGENWIPKTEENDAIVLGVANPRPHATPARFRVNFNSLGSKVDLIAFKTSEQLKKKEESFLRKRQWTTACNLTGSDHTTPSYSPKLFLSYD